MLHLDEPLATGRTRTIYAHPKRKGWLIKVENDLGYGDTGKLGTLWRRKLAHWFGLEGENQREINIYRRFNDALIDFVPAIELEPIETDQGLGLVCQQILNDDGSRAASIADILLEQGELSDELTSQLNRLLSLLLDKHLFFFDLNLDNFLVQTIKGKSQIRFIDLKGYRRDRSLLPITKVSSRMAKKKMERRIKKLNQRLKIGAACLAKTHRP